MRLITTSVLLLTLMLTSLSLAAQNPKAANMESKRNKKLTRYEETDLRQQADFLAAVQGGDLEGAETNFKAHYFYAKDEGGETPFTRAIKNKDVDMVRFLEKKAVINLPNAHGEIPLILALESGDQAIIELVMERASPSLQDDKGRSPIMIALEKRDLALLRILIGKGADVNERSQGKTPIFRAAELNNLEAVAMLAHNGADPAIANHDGDIPLYHALRNGYQAMAGILLHKSSQPEVDANWKNEEGEPLLHLAIKNDQNQISQLLLEFGADPHRTDYFENTPLNLAAQKGKVALVKALLAKGADPNHRNMMGETPVLSAARNGYRQVANLLTEVGADGMTSDFDDIITTDNQNVDNLTDADVVDAVMEVSNESGDY